ncbi:hypothetical protein [Nocardioides ferulae]|uniref:hypothetical protein n=1 Tax=Nocardioides ferulae TaxID=2340821 RepID=UPI000EAEABF5|nr:hypothetical protein [Nocardioides ferulae]
MTDLYGVVPEPLAFAARDWGDLAELMERSSSDLGGQGVGALAPSVQAAASAFLTAWAGYAGESAAIARGFSSALDALVADATHTDDAIDTHFGGIDARLGPAR